MNRVPTRIDGRVHDLGDGFSVRRMLPALASRHVGSLVFFDHIGPARFEAGKAWMCGRIRTLAWPRSAGCSTARSVIVTAWAGLADIRQGEVNWMTAGRGIVHSERTPPDQRRDGQTLHGVQIWVALPQADAEVAPTFHHHQRAALPSCNGPVWTRC